MSKNLANDRVFHPSEIVGPGKWELRDIPTRELQHAPGVKLNEQYVREFADAMDEEGNFDITKVSAEALFADITYFDTKGQVAAITHRCLHCDEDPLPIPMIDWHPELKRYVWWALSRGDTISKRPAFAAYFEKLHRDAAQTRTEAGMQRGFVSWLRGRGIACKEQVRCAAGIADVVDDEHCYELKLNGLGNLFSAIGQAVAYAACLNRKPVVVLNRPGRAGVMMAAEAAGVRVIVFPEDS